MRPPRRRRRPPQEREPATYWNYQPTPRARVRVIVDDDPQFPLYWARQYSGQLRHAVRVDYEGARFYLDDADGSGWHKVTHGGGPDLMHRNLAIRREVPW